MLELAEEALDQIAMSIVLGYSLAGGKVRPWRRWPHYMQESVSVMTAVSHDIAALKPFQRRKMANHADHEPEPGISIS